MQFRQKGDVVGGGGLSYIEITQAQYDANPSAYDSPDTILHIIDAPSELMGASSVGYESTNMKMVGDMVTKGIAPKIEFSDTATYAHTVGEYFYNKNGEYCKCTSAVSIGQTLTKNTNYVVTDVASEIEGINSDLTVRPKCISGVVTQNVTIPNGINEIALPIPTGMPHKPAVGVIITTPANKCLMTWGVASTSPMLDTQSAWYAETYQNSGADKVLSWFKYCAFYYD